MELALALYLERILEDHAELLIEEPNHAAAPTSQR
jgi:hypothetical protein